MEVVY